MAVLSFFLRVNHPGAIRSLWTALLLGLTVGGVFLPRAAAETAISAEYKVKAVFLFNFTQFVEWPAGAFSSDEAPLVIGILGGDPFDAYLDDLVKGEKVGRRPLVVRRCKSPEEIAGCHILFINRSRAAELPQILERLKGRSVLTVSDLDTFNRQGGMMRLATEAGKIQLKISVAPAKSAGLVISSKILSPRTIVPEGKG